MSVQTGVEAPDGPASQRIGDRMRYRVDMLKNQPNPLWVREMRQSARLVRTPVILLVVAILVALLMASIGGILSGSGQSPAEAGSLLFQTFFSLAWFVVTLIGPALAANSIASEREGKTWEAVLLTGMRPSEIVRGKFMYAFTAIGMYIVMLAPVGALPFLYGGVTPVEVLLAFVYLFFFAMLSVAFGLAISAKMQSLRGALLVTLLVAAPLSLFTFSVFGFGGSVVAHDLWSAVETGYPIWLPTAYGSAPFGVEYVVYLVLLPMALIAVPAWLLYEVTRSNLTSVTDDRTFGLKKWFVGAAVLLGATAVVPVFSVNASDRVEASMVGMGFFAMFLMFSSFLFCGEQIGPSRRVIAMLKGAGRFRRALSPGVNRAARLQLIVGLSLFGAVAGSAAAYVFYDGGVANAIEATQIALFATYAVGFSLFTIGMSAYLRSRSQSALVPRVLLLVILFFVTTGPWIVAAISGLISRSGGPESLVLAAPSPLYAVFAVEALTKPSPEVPVTAALIAAGVYALLGFICLGAAQYRCNKIIDEHEAILTEADRRLAEEDALADEENRVAEVAREARAEAAKVEEAERLAQDVAPAVVEVGETKD